ncbi:MULTISPECIES: ABC transporter ATP-binding protein [Paenibacillus]|uniref:ABC transporter ATP-binding protein n=1 Tax=Paenibacillus TaxID=44249 RepID=UPI00096FAF51|nr:ABC transporter ATP-binding protein [Paenibacillus odorifer]MEC0131931.1 ABC transporter ATP-binding protein [Paenibacillus odorifer]MEC0221615.1 ABC transporter ATP-binding protein [Paenibacillus odorifer]OMD19336.1 ABC transporter ATP-binding protein [Paenibacillus odorifer]OME16490.1 ABC transporter ATP-binding protein [Paenibacillus odorifer]OME25787.1 ABC transporter ATP-binding protein [Paenibacillus odorifer]
MLKKSLAHLKCWVGGYILLGFAIQLLSSLGVVVFQKILDKATVINSFDEIATLIMVYGALLAGVAILNYIDEYPSVFLSNSITERLKIIALSKISKMDYQAYQDMGTGQMIKVIENGAAAGNSIIFSFFLKTLHELLPTLLFSLVFISFYDLRIMLVIAAGYVVVFLITNLLLKFLYAMKATILQEQEKMSRFSIRGFMELVVFRTNKRYEKEIEKLSQTARTIIHKNAQLKMIHEAFFAIFELFVTIIKVVVLIYGVKSIVAGETSLGIVVALFMFIDKIYTPIAIFNVLFVDYRLNKVTYRRFEEFIAAPEDKNLESGEAITELQGNIEFREVSFTYGNVQILNNLSFSLTRGTSVAIVGLSGGGKSTLIKLIVGLLKKGEGELLLDGKDIDEIRLNSYYDHISYLSQDTPIFDATIRDNIVFDEDTLSDEELYEILEKVHLQEKVSHLPDRLDTLVGEKGLKLSGGERQRLAFARIIAQKRNILILDEPVSALDNITEQSLMETILNEFKDKTIIIVAHRLNFIKDVDKILVVDQGSIVGEGKFDDLIEQCEAFKALWNRKISFTDYR